MSIREFVESPVTQGEDETLTWALTTTPWGSSPTGSVVTVKDMTAGGGAVSVCSGTATAGDVISVTLGGLTVGHNYRCEVRFTSGGNVFEGYMIVRCEQ